MPGDLIRRLNIKYPAVDSRGVYDFIDRAPGVDDYNRVRVDAGLSSKPREAAQRALAGSLYAVLVEHDGEVAGFGRIVGDGGLLYEVVDVAVLPEHQGLGIGAGIMEHLMSYLHNNVTYGMFVRLHDGQGVSGLYERYGF